MLSGNSKKAKPVKKFCPSHLEKSPNTAFNRGHITGLAYSWDGKEIVATYSRDFIYLFNVDDTNASERSEIFFEFS